MVNECIIHYNSTMAEYYFYNLTQNKSNFLPIHGYGERIFVTNLHLVTGAKIIEIFKAVATANDWAPTDVLEATCGSRSVIYHNGTFSWESHGHETGDHFTPLLGKYPIETYDGRDGYDSMDDPEVKEDYDW